MEQQSQEQVLKKEELKSKEIEEYSSESRGAAYEELLHQIDKLGMVQLAV